MKYLIKTDAISAPVEARTEDEAAQKFAEQNFRGEGIKTAAALEQYVNAHGGWVRIIED